jgi:hypothetical protein
MSVAFLFELIALFTAIFCYKDLKATKMVFFIPFLLLTVFVEFIGYLSVIYAVKEKNYWIYNIFTAVEFIFYAYLFVQYFKLPFLRKVALYFIPLIIVFSLTNYIFLQGTEHFHTYTLLFGSFFLVLFCCCYFYEWVLPEQINQNLLKQPFFWVCVGLLLFYLGSVIINALYEYLRSSDMVEEGKHIYVLINRSLNVVLYSSFSISFILCRNNRKTSSSPL